MKTSMWILELSLMVQRWRMKSGKYFISESDKESLQS